LRSLLRKKKRSRIYSLEIESARSAVQEVGGKGGRGGMGEIGKVENGEKWSADIERISG
jgi:hypothetical protein